VNVVATVLFAVLFAGPAWGQQVCNLTEKRCKVRWTANPESNIKEYKIFTRPEGQPFWSSPQIIVSHDPAAIDAEGFMTEGFVQYWIDNGGRPFRPGINYLAMISVNTNQLGNESILSGEFPFLFEVIVTPPTGPPSPVMGIEIVPGSQP